MTAAAARPRSRRLCTRAVSTPPRSSASSARRSTRTSRSAPTSPPIATVAGGRDGHRRRRPPDAGRAGRGRRGRRRLRPGRRRGGRASRCSRTTVPPPCRAGRCSPVTGPTRSLLTAERTALNLIGRLSGVATLTRHWVDAVEGTAAAIRDTRKTTPGLRALEKYAVRCGGGVNHRMALGDAALVKDNHVAAAGGIAAAVEAVRAHAPEIPLEVECDTLDQVREAHRRRGGARAAGQLLARRHPHRGRARAPGRQSGSRPAAASRSTGPARSPRPASTTWLSARSPTARRCSTSASTYGAARPERSLIHGQASRASGGGNP